MKPMLGPIELKRYSDAQLDDLLAKVEMMGGKGILRDSLKREIIRRKAVNVTAGMVNTSDPWLVQVKPGQWVTASTADLMVSAGMAMQMDGQTVAEIEATLKRLLEAGIIRPNPARTRIEEVR